MLRRDSFTLLRDTLRWRVALVQKALRQGRALKLIADDVGYGSESALSRSFKASCGVSPREWKQTQEAGKR